MILLLLILALTSTPEPKVQILAHDGSLIASCRYFDEATATPSKCEIAKGHTLDEVMEMTVVAVRNMKDCGEASPTRMAHQYTYPGWDHQPVTVSFWDLGPWLENTPKKAKKIWQIP